MHLNIRGLEKVLHNAAYVKYTREAVWNLELYVNDPIGMY